MSALDPREGNLTVWITATRNDVVLSKAELEAFAAPFRRPEGPVIRVVVHEAVACISIRGDHFQRNAVLEHLGNAFYEANFKWIRTTGNFDWLRRQVKEAARALAAATD